MDPVRASSDMRVVGGAFFSSLRPNGDPRLIILFWVCSGSRGLCSRSFPQLSWAPAWQLSSAFATQSRTSLGMDFSLKFLGSPSLLYCSSVRWLFDDFRGWLFHYCLGHENEFNFGNTKGWYRGRIQWPVDQSVHTIILGEEESIIVKRW